MSFESLGNLRGKEIELSAAGCAPVTGVLTGIGGGVARFADGSIVHLGSESFSARPIRQEQPSTDRFEEYIDHNGNSTYYPSSGSPMSPDPGHPYDW